MPENEKIIMVLEKALTGTDMNHALKTAEIVLNHGPKKWKKMNLSIQPNSALIGDFLFVEQ